MRTVFVFVLVSSLPQARRGILQIRTLPTVTGKVRPAHTTGSATLASGTPYLNAVQASLVTKSWLNLTFVRFGWFKFAEINFIMKLTTPMRGMSEHNEVK